jgi:hypothetical protein
MTRILVLVFALLALPATAQDRLSVLIGSHHAGAAPRVFEGSNPGLILTWEDRGGLDWSVAAYRNSYGRTSVAALAGLPVAHWRGGAASVVAGLAWYPQDGRDFPVHAGDVVPLVGLQLRHRAAFVLILPGDGTAADAVIAAGITFQLETRP